MKNIAIYGNCHTSIIIKYLLYSDTIKNNYLIDKIYIVDYLENEKLDDKSIKILKSADIFLCQYIEKNRGELTHEFLIMNYLKKDCIILKFPHYRFDCYLLNNDVYNSISVSLSYIPKIPIEIIKLFNEVKNYDEFNQKFNTIFNSIKIINNDSLDEILNNEKIKFAKINKFSSIDMYEFVLNNYKKKRLFGLYAYPTGYFFYEFVRKILNSININDMIPYNENEDCIYNNWNHTLYPIIPPIYNSLGLEHNTKYNKLNIKNYYENISSLSEYYYKIIEIFYTKINKNINEENKLLISNNLNISYFVDLNFINFKNYNIKKINSITIIEEIINDPKINYSFGLIIPKNIDNINLIDDNIDIKLNAIFIDENDAQINTINLFDGKKWHNNIINYNGKIFNINLKTSSNPRINFGNSKIVKIIKCNMYYII